MGARLTAAAALDRHFLETRCKILEIAANLDRIDRGACANTALTDDPRLRQIHDSLRLLLDGRPNRAERCQMIFSLAYDAAWQPPNRGRSG
jgi:hypothetical protein